MLASASPRRRELLRSVGLRFDVRPVDLDETPRAEELGEVYVERLACEKAEAKAASGELVLAADTIVERDAAILGKPRDRIDARRMLESLAGRWHRVLSGVALHDPRAVRTAAVVVASRVRLAALDEEEIDWYSSTGEPDDKAGGYAIQGLGGLFVESIEGSYSNVVGLPLAATYRLFREFGYDLRAFRDGD